MEHGYIKREYPDLIISYSQLMSKPEMSLQTSSILDWDVCEIWNLEMNSWRKILLVS